MVRIGNLKSHPYNKTVFREIDGNEWEAFKESIKQDGLQVQIEITSDNIILCGHQRIRALKELYGNEYDLADSKVWIRKDLESEDKVMTDIKQRMRVIEDNQLRRHLNDGEKTMIYMEKKRLEEVLAKIRQKEHGETAPNKPKNTSGKSSTSDIGKSRDKASEGLNLSGKTLENYKKMYDLATKEEREYFLKTGKILDSLKKRYKEKKQEEARKRAEEADKLRKKKLEEKKQKQEKEEVKRKKEEAKKRKAIEKQKKKELEEKIKQEKLKKEEAERLRKEAEAKKKEEEEERKRLEEEQRIKEEEAKQNRPELLLTKKFRDEGLPIFYTGSGEQQFYIANKRPDWKVEGKKQIIEYCGTYWHTKEEIEDRKKLFESNNYKVFIIWEGDERNMNELIKKIKEFLHNG